MNEWLLRHTDTLMFPLDTIFRQGLFTNISVTDPQIYPFNTCDKNAWLIAYLLPNRKNSLQSSGLGCVAVDGATPHCQDAVVLLNVQ